MLWVGGSFVGLFWFVGWWEWGACICSEYPVETLLLFALYYY